MFYCKLIINIIVMIIFNWSIPFSAKTIPYPFRSPLNFQRFIILYILKIVTFIITVINNKLNTKLYNTKQ